MSPEPFVSVVIAAYNYGRYLGQAIDSALAQEWPADRLEVIVVDDGSTDDTPAVMAAYGDRVRGIRTPNRGVLAATDTALHLARGRYIALLDADDFWPAGRTRVLVDALEAEPAAGIAHGDLHVVDADGVMTGESYREMSGVGAASGWIYGRLLRNCLLNTNAMLLRASVVAGILPLRSNCPYQDWWLALECAKVAPVVSVPDAVAYYRAHGANAVLGNRNGLRLVRRELPFRRWILATHDMDTVPPAELKAALDQFDLMVATVAYHDPAALAELVPVDAARERAAMDALVESSRRLDAGSPAGAVAPLVRAAVEDPFADTPRALLSQLLGLDAVREAALQPA
jgi:glycosyltransferase involved in cell wall biosynthesis